MAVGELAFVSSCDLGKINVTVSNQKSVRRVRSLEEEKMTLGQMWNEGKDVGLKWRRRRGPDAGAWLL